jgi:hypothetical protein
VAAIPAEALDGLHPEVAEAYAAALERLRAAGVDVRMVTPIRRGTALLARPRR